MHPGLRDQAFLSTFLLLDGMDGRGYLAARYKPRLNLLVCFPLGLCVSHDHFEHVVTFSLQLEIRRVSSRFEAYEPNFHNPLEGLPEVDIIVSLGIRVSYTSVFLREFGFDG